MFRKIKKVAIGLVAVAVIITGFQVKNYLDNRPADTSPIKVADNLDGFTSGDSDSNSVKGVYVTPTATPIPKEYSDAGLTSVIEKDDETGAVLGKDTTGKNVIVKDKSLEEAEKPLADSLKDKKTLTDDEIQALIAESNQGTKDYIDSVEETKAEEKKAADEKVTDTKPAKDTKTADSKKDTKIDTAKSDAEIDEATRELFAEQGWDLGAAKNQYDIPKDAVWTIDHEDRNYNGVFSPAN